MRRSRTRKSLFKTEIWLLIWTLEIFSDFFVVDDVDDDRNGDRGPSAARAAVPNAILRAVASSRSLCLSRYSGFASTAR